MKIKRDIIIQYSAGCNWQCCIAPVGDKCFVTNVNIVRVLHTTITAMQTILQYESDVAVIGHSPDICFCCQGHLYNSLAKFRLLFE